MNSALILFAHGARDPEWARPLRCVQTMMRDMHPEARVELAFLEFMTPELAVSVDRLVAEGVTDITVVPMFIAQGGHLKRELPVMMESLRQRHPGLSLSLSGPIGEQPAVLAAMAEAASAWLATP